MNKLCILLLLGTAFAQNKVYMFSGPATPATDTAFNAVFNAGVLDGVVMETTWSSLDTSTSCPGSCTYNWTPLDTTLLGNYTSGTYSGLKLKIILAPARDASVCTNGTCANTSTPNYVYDGSTQHDCTCSSYTGGLSTGYACTTPAAGSNVGWPLMTDTRASNAYAQMISAIIAHLNGVAYKSQIGMLVIGLAKGGENVPQCSTQVETALSITQAQLITNWESYISTMVTAAKNASPTFPITFTVGCFGNTLPPAGFTTNNNCGMSDTMAGYFRAAGFGLRVTTAQTADYITLAGGTPTTADWVNLFSTYATAPSLSVQQSAESDPTAVYPTSSGTNCGSTAGSLTQLIPFVSSHMSPLAGERDMEIYAADLKAPYAGSATFTDTCWPAGTVTSPPYKPYSNAIADFRAGQPSGASGINGSGSTQGTSGLNSAALSVLGPPLYLGSSTSTANPGTISALFPSTAPTATTCSGACQNSTAYDTTTNPSGVDCYTRGSDGTTFPSGKSVGGFTASSGANDFMWSMDELYLSVTANGGFIYTFQINSSGNCAQIVNTGVPTISTSGSFGWSRNSSTPHTFYSISDGHTLNSYTVTSISVMPTANPVFNFTAAGACPGLPNPMTVTGENGILIPNDGDTRFTVIISTSVQNTAVWTASYDKNLGCATANWQTGQVWGWCNASCGPTTPPLGTFPTTGDSCWGANPGASTGGIHDAEQSVGGKYYLITINGTWTQGICAGNANGNQFISWEIGTLNNTWCDGETNTTTGHCASHYSLGYTTLLSPSYQNWNRRPLSNVGNGYTDFVFNPNAEDSHQAWPHPNGDDTFPYYIVATDSALSTSQSGCGDATLCPTYANNLLIGIPIFTSSLGAPIRVFGHTFACGDGPSYAECGGIADAFGPGNAIGTVSPKGNFYAFGTTDLHGSGNDNTGVPRADFFIVRLQ